MSSNASHAKSLLVFYLRQVYESAGLQWDTDNEAEVDTIVEGIIDAAAEKAKEQTR